MRPNDDMMSDQELPEAKLPADFVNEVRDALVHLYDHAYLARHPLVQRLRAHLGDAGMVAHNLRRLLLEHVEALRPPASIPSQDTAWRPYYVLYRRYVLGQDLAEVERELNLGRRQLQREQRRALFAVALSLWERCGEREAPEAGHEASQELLREISHAATERQHCDIWEQLCSALETVEALARVHGIVVQTDRPQERLLVQVDPTLFRQLLVGALSFVLRWPGVRELRVKAQRSFGKVACILQAELGDSPIEGTQPELTETLLYLAQTQGAEIALRETSGRRSLYLSLPLVLQERTILVVEDNRDLVALYTRYLAGHGYRLLGESDATKALEAVAEIMPDAVLLDVMMRDVDGWSILKKIKEDPHLTHIPVAVCSVLDERELALSLGAAAYLRKPVRPAQLLECLRQLLPA